MGNVRIGVMSGPAPTTRTTGRAASPDGAKWIRLGTDTVIYAPTAQWRRVVERSRSGDVAVRERPRPARAEDLHVVVQIGRRFQQSHPEVPVILDKGRYLVVELSRKAHQALKQQREPCYAIRPVAPGQVVFDVRSPRAGRRAREPWLDELVGQLSRERFRESLAHLVSGRTRHSTSPEYRDMARWARDRLATLGYEVRQQEITVGPARSENVVADRRGRGAGARDLVLVVAHLDSVNAAGGPGAKAPGADDNGSGSAGLLEMAHVLGAHPAEHDLRFVLFGGEEQGLFGSQQYVAGLSEPERSRIRAIVNMDMIASLNAPTPAVLLEGAAVSRSVVDGLAEAAATYSGLAVQTSFEPFNSDHVPFIDAGLPAVLTIEGTDSANHRVHTADDTVAHLDEPLALDILRTNVAFVGRAVGRVSDGTARVSAPRPESAILAVLGQGRDVVEALRRLPFQFSGCYTHNGGAVGRRAQGFVDRQSGLTYAALENPIYPLEKPVYVEESSARLPAMRAAHDVRFTLHIDVDGSDPLNVVSGSVEAGAPPPGAVSPHFIGRVTSNTATGEARQVVVEEFRFQWPDSGEPIDRLEIRLAGSALATPVAEVTFKDTARELAFGPYTATQDSSYFRDVEIDLDREENAVAVEPCPATGHPDRPLDLPDESMTLQSVFAKAGVRITYSPGSGSVVPNPGADRRWSNLELHDSMKLHWDSFANRPQWKMWIFVAELAEDDLLGGVMFDADINEPGGVDRQGTAIFTRSPYFHTEAGGYIKANPPPVEAIRRELFFNLVHETGHAFNLAHSFQKQLSAGPGEGAWTPPAWMPLASNPQALSWMNYPDAATPGAGAGANATWFYQRFRFRFDDGELLFLRHAPESYAQMGNATWFQHHGRVARTSLDRRLEFKVRTLKSVVELGEPVIVELRLASVSDEPVVVHTNLDPSDGLVEVAVTNPQGQRFPFLPIMHARGRVKQHILPPKGRLYHAMDLTVGQFGFAFKEPGAYRIEASYVNLDGGTAAAVMQLFVRQGSFDEMRTVSRLWHAEVGRALQVGGTLVMEEVNERLDDVRKGFDARHPLAQHLTAVRYRPLARPTKRIDPRTNEVKVAEGEPDRFVAELTPIVEDTKTCADSLGHIRYHDLVDLYTESALEIGQRKRARGAQAQMLQLFKARHVVAPVVAQVERRVRELS